MTIVKKTGSAVTVRLKQSNDGPAMILITGIMLRRN